MAEPRLVDAMERLMRAAVGVTTRSLAEAGAAADLTLQQWRAVMLVAESGPDGVRVGEIGRRLGIDRPGATRLVGRLGRRGLVAVAPDPADGRATLVRTTDAGADLVAAVVERRRGHIRAALEDLAADQPAATPLVESFAAAFAGHA